MTLYGSLADDMYMNVNLATEMELPGIVKRSCTFSNVFAKSFQRCESFMHVTSEITCWKIKSRTVSLGRS